MIRFIRLIYPHQILLVQQTMVEFVKGRQRALWVQKLEVAHQEGQLLVAYLAVVVVRDVGAPVVGKDHEAYDQGVVVAPLELHVQDNAQATHCAEVVVVCSYNGSQEVDHKVEHNANKDTGHKVELDVLHIEVDSMGIELGQMDCHSWRNLDEGAYQPLAVGVAADVVANEDAVGEHDVDALAYWVVTVVVVAAVVAEAEMVVVE